MELHEVLSLNQIDNYLNDNFLTHLKSKSLVNDKRFDF